MQSSRSYALYYVTGGAIIGSVVWLHFRRRRGQASGMAVSALPKEGTFAPLQDLMESIDHICGDLPALPMFTFARGLYSIASAGYESEPQQRGVVTELSSDMTFLSDASHWCQMAEAAYASDEDQFSLMTGLPCSAILAACWDTNLDTLRPAYVLALDAPKSALVLIIRGTKDLTDLATNATAKPAAFLPNLDGVAHSGMATAARLIWAEIGDCVSDLRAQFPSLEFVLVGHSMGAAVAALLTVLINTSAVQCSGGVRTARCLAFCPPSCTSAPLGELCAPWVTSLACTHDIIPCLSVHAARRLQGRVSATQGDNSPNCSDIDRAQLCPEATEVALEMGNDLYPPGRILLLGYTEASGRRETRPRPFPTASCYSRAYGVPWGNVAGRPQWALTEASREDFHHMPISPWVLSDHMLSTVAEGLYGLQRACLTG